MPTRRALLTAIAAGVGVTIYFAGWQSVPTFLAVAIGATMGIVLLLFASSLADDPAKADAAWREAAPDLAARERSEPANEPDADAWPNPADRGT